MIIQPEWISAAQSVHKALYPRGPFASVTIAQGAIESAWFTKPSGKNNYFGIQATSYQREAGRATPRNTREFVNGAFQPRVEYFADYDSLADGFLAHGVLLVQPWYNDCIAATTVAEYCEALVTDHYETGPGYSALLKSIIAEFSLEQYDIVPSALAQNSIAI